MSQSQRTLSYCLMVQYCYILRMVRKSDDVEIQGRFLASNMVYRASHQIKLCDEQLPPVCRQQVHQTVNNVTATVQQCTFYFSFVR